MKQKISKTILGTLLAALLIFSTAVPVFAATGTMKSDGIIYLYDTGTKTAAVADCDTSLSGDVTVESTIEVGGEEYPVTSIGNYAFSDCTGLTSIEIPESVTSIGYGTFDNCCSLTSIEIPNSVTSIGDRAFFNCRSLTSIEIPERVTSIGISVFYGCESLTSIEIPEGVTSIGYCAFCYCTGLTDAYFPKNASLGGDLFQNTNQPINVWYYEVLKSADESSDGKNHVAITALKDKNGAAITEPKVIKDDAMGDGYFIDEVRAENLSLNHALTKTEAKAPTCTADGNKEYWTCGDCGKIFADEKAETEITLADTVVKATGHKLTKTEEKDPTCTESGNIEYWTCDVCGKYFADEKAETEITFADTVVEATGHNYTDSKCTVCGTIDPDFKAVITAGANGEWQKGTKDGLSFTSNAAFAHFLKVQVDGKDLDASDYTVKEGSTIVTLKAEYLETLTVGKHTFAVVSETGTAGTEFTVKAAAADEETYQTQDTGKENANAPQTGWNSNMMIWIALLTASCAAVLVLGVCTKKRRFVKR